MNIYETSRQSSFDARYWLPVAGALGRPREMVCSGWETYVYLWEIHFDIWQNQYNIAKLNKIKFKKINKTVIGRYPVIESLKGFLK